MKNFNKYIELQNRIRNFPEFNSTPLENLYKLDKEELIKEYAEYRRFSENKIKLITEFLDFLVNELF